MDEEKLKKDEANEKVASKETEEKKDEGGRPKPFIPKGGVY